jgi:hypothetical protein
MTLRTLTDDELLEVGDILKERHPMAYDGTRIEDVFPIYRCLKSAFSCCLCCFKSKTADPDDDDEDENQENKAHRRDKSKVNLLRDGAPRSDVVTPAGSAANIFEDGTQRTDELVVVRGKIEEPEHPTEPESEGEGQDAAKGFMKLGYGTVSYFNFHEYMIILFVVLCCLVCPNFWIFNDFDGGD